ncbi:MAG: DUF294 nucleotidyltransferase-like domain-containing protein, partial [Trichloromonas sp.]|nr:DUF294 nucleotidyltransferase-like domain-containing protein [Trichloromonas sp.]
MTEENVFFFPVGDFCRRDLITCPAEATVAELAAIMRERNVSSIIVREGETPVGIITDRDLRNKVVSRGADPATLTARAIMSEPLITVAEDQSLLEVVCKMSRHNIHRIGVADGEGQLCGIVNESDILRQTHSPQRLLHDLERAESLDELKKIHQGVQDLVVFLSRSGVRTKDLVRLIATLNDRLVLRLIDLLRRERFADLPENFVFMVLGSEGRGEQTLSTDQDNAIICADGLDAEALGRIETFSQALIDGLIQIGVPECPGGIMAKNTFWRRSLEDWSVALDQRISVPSPENILSFSMFADIRGVWGGMSLVDSLKSAVIRRAMEEDLFLSRMAANVVRFVPPLGMFGSLKVEKQGAYRGLIDLKKPEFSPSPKGSRSCAWRAAGSAAAPAIRFSGSKSSRFFPSSSPTISTRPSACWFFTGCAVRSMPFAPGWNRTTISTPPNLTASNWG